MSGQWSGGAANRQWARPGRRVFDTPADRARFAEKFPHLMDARFWCDNCGGNHPLREHRDCRATHPFRNAFRGST